MKIGEFEPGEIPVCSLQLFKNAPEEHRDMVMRYAYNGKMFAFRINSQGLYCNLLTFGDTPSECAAKMLLNLLEERILTYGAKVN